MIRGLGLLIFLLVNLRLPARSQPGPAQGYDPVTASELASEAKRSPTTPQNVRRRFHRVLDFARSHGRPGRYLRRDDVESIAALIDQGRLQEASKLVDSLIRGLETARGEDGGGPRPPGPSGPPGGMPLERGETPLMLATPQLARPILAPFAESKLAIVPAPTPEPGASGPWKTILAGMGLILIAAGALYALLSRKPRETQSPPGAQPEKTLTEKYSIDHLISSGGMGEVYEGRDLTLGRRVALKRMLPDLKLDAALRKQFLQEARTVAKLTHPYIVQIHDCLEKGEDVYLVFEFVKGKTLAQILTEKPRLSLKECLRIFAHVCPAIDYAHKNHILHRDLKPANIMVDENGIARVMDFGIALESTRTMSSTGPGHLDASGTLRYMPPEQHYGKSVRASDVYAMGVCLYEMTTGTLPFAAGSVDELIAQKRARRFPAPSMLVPSLPKEFDLFVTSVLAPDPKDRMAGALEFLELLEQIAA